jgi:peptide/nickel transport system substrate-binding protein
MDHNARGFKLRLHHITALALVIFSLICLPTVSLAKEAPSKVTIGMWSSPGNSLLPHFYHLGYARSVFQICFNSLLAWDDDFNLTPKLAESYSVSKDQMTYRFKIRDNANWHDGKPVTSADVKFTVECLSDPDYAFMDFNLVAGIKGAKARKKGETKEISGFKIIDDKTFEVTTDGIFSPLLDAFGTELHILPRHILKDVKVAEMASCSFAAKPTVGNGPYKFVRYETDRFVEFTANKDFYLGAPKIEKVYIMIVNPDTAVAQLEKGELDMLGGGSMSALPNIEIARVKRVPHLDIQASGGPASQGMFFYTGKEKFKDFRVRRAFAHAINTKGIVKKILLGNGVVTPILYGESYPFQNKNLKPYTYDPKKAKELLKEANWDPETEVKMVVPTGNKERIQWATVAQQNLRNVGVKANLTQMDIATLIRTIRKTPEDLDVFFLGHKNYLDPFMFFHRRFSEESIPGGNLTYYRNAKVNELIEELKLVVDMDAKRKITDQISEILYKELPVVSICNPTETIAVNKKVHGPKMSILPINRNIHEWYIK